MYLRYHDYSLYSIQELRKSRDSEDKGNVMNTIIKMAEAKFIEDDGRDWYALTGTDYGTSWDFSDDVYGVHQDGTILDIDGFPLTDGDTETIAVRNTIGA